MNIFEVTTSDAVYVVIADTKKEASALVIEKLNIPDLAEINTVTLKGPVQEGVILHYKYDDIYWW